MDRTKLLRNISFKQKLLLSYILIISIPFTIFGVFSYFSLVQSVRENSYKTIEQIIQNEKGNIDNKIVELEDKGYQISTNTIFARFFSDSYYSDKSLIDTINFDINPLIEWLNIENQKFTNIMFLTTNENIPENVNMLWLNSFSQEDWLKKAEAALQRNKNYWEGYHQTRPYKYSPIRSQYAYSLFYTLFQSKYPKMTYLELEINPGYLFKSFANMPIGKTGGTIIVYNNVNNVSGKNGKLTGNLQQNPDFKLFLQGSENDCRLNIDRVDYYLYKERIDKLDTYIVAYIPIKEVTEAFSKAKYLFMSSLALAFILLFVISLFITGVLLKRIKKMLAAVRRIQKGDFAVSIPVNGSDEIDELANDINIMAEKINNLFNNVYKAKIVQKDLELNVLQSQINPHFIFNTLETFKMMAEINNEEEISDGLTILGSLIRYNTSIGRKFSNIQAEIANVDNYIKIQNLLLNNRIKVEYSIDSSLADHTIPTFILQPIVENCINHGFKNIKGELVIHITIVKEGNSISFLIKDTGRGVPEERLGQIKQALSRDVDDGFPPEGSTNIALVNINRRVKLLFGNDYGIDINNNTDCGATVYLKIPFSQNIDEGT